MENNLAMGKLRELEAVLAAIGAKGDVAVALSGGVDSVTLAAAAHAALGPNAAMYHARSPAVPAEAAEAAAPGAP